MSDLASVVSVTVSTQTAGVTATGFGMPLILSANASFTERVRTYTDLAGMVTDGFASTSPEYKAASAMFSQSPKPPTIAVGRRALKPTLRWAVTPTAVNSFTYSMKFNGSTLTFTADSSATVTEVIAGLKSAIDALSLPVTVSDQTTFMRIVENVAGAWHECSILGTPGSENLSLAMDHADPGLATDLAAIAVENNDWYGIANLYNSPAEIAAIALYAEANTKLFVAASQDTTILGSGTSDVASTEKALAHTKTAIFYHRDNGEFADAAILGKCLPKTPGSETWMFKTLSGVTAGSFTSTQLTNLRAKYCGWYATLGGINQTFEGKVASGTYIDVVRGIDWATARYQEAVVSLFANSDKVAYTDKGISAVCAALRGVQQLGVDNGLFSDNPAPTVTAPRASAATTGDKAARLLSGVKADATIAGAIHKVALTATLSL
jgi:hypothetical protein